jgi:hypothetical protein
MCRRLSSGITLVSPLASVRIACLWRMGPAGSRACVRPRGPVRRWPPSPTKTRARVWPCRQLPLPSFLVWTSGVVAQKVLRLGEALPTRTPGFATATYLPSLTGASRRRAPRPPNDPIVVGLRCGGGGAAAAPRGGGGCRRVLERWFGQRRPACLVVRFA